MDPNRAEEPWPKATESEWDEDEHARWLDQWAPSCPIGNPQRVAELLGYREREPGRLQLRVAVRPALDGICEAIVEEDDDRVQVRVLLCYQDDEEGEEDDLPRRYEEWNCPTHVQLEKPLGGRQVIDVDTQKPLPLHVPNW